jgi:zinc transport system substrate-binding protein
MIKQLNIYKLSLITFLFTITLFSLPLHADAGDRLTIYTINYPLTYFAERIGGEYVKVEFPVSHDVDPAFWKPDDETVRQFQKADLIILNGAGYEKWTRKVSLPMLKLVDTSKAFSDQLIHIETNVTHSHGPKGDHSHGGTAFTTWLDFSQAAMQAEAIYKAIIRILPAQKTVLEKNFEELKNDILNLDRQMAAIGEHSAQAPFFASHPIYQYLARRYNMNITMMMWEPDADPGPPEWLHLQEVLKDHPAKWMIWEGEALGASVEKLKTMGISSVVFAPCMNKPEAGDFMRVMERNIKNLQRVFATSPEKLK